jgi:hypothetical protein
MYGDCKLDEKGKLMVTRKYKYEGNPNELVFYNHFIGFV